MYVCDMFDANMKISPVEIGSPVSKRRWYLKQGSLWKDISETGLIGESGWGKQTLTDLHWKLKIGTIGCCLERNTRLRRSRHWIEDEGGGGTWKYFLLIMNLLFLGKNYCFGETLLSCRRMIGTFNLLQNTYCVAKMPSSCLTLSEKQWLSVAGGLSYASDSRGFEVSEEQLPPKDTDLSFVKG